MQKAETSSKHISLEGLSNVFPDDSDIIETLNKEEQQQNLDDDQKKILQLMTSNRERMSYKKALAATIADVRNGVPFAGNKRKDE